MKKMKAVVLEKSGFRYTVLSENGTFRHVHRRQNAEVGEEIEIQLPFSESFRGLSAWAGVAAMFILVLTTLFAWNLYQAPTAVALLSVDINPSIQFTIDGQGNLLKINSKNEDADRLLSNLDLKGKPVERVLEEFAAEAYNQSFLNSGQSWIVVGYSFLTSDTSEEVEENFKEGQITSRIIEEFEEKGFTPQVAFFEVTSQDRELAQKENLTLGEYALWQTAIKAGVDTPAEKLRDKSERGRLLENPKVQVQATVDKKDPESASSVKGPIDKYKEDRIKNNPQKKGMENPNKTSQNNPEENNKNGVREGENNGKDADAKAKKNLLEKDMGEDNSKSEEKEKEKNNGYDKDQDKGQGQGNLSSSKIVKQNDERF